MKNRSKYSDRKGLRNPHWSEKYIQMPYDKYNCAEFVEMVMNEEFGKDYTFPQSEGNVFIQSHQIKKNYENYVERRKLGEFEEGDLVLMSGKRRLCHIGLIVNINYNLYILHSLNSVGYVCRTKLNRLPELGLKFEGIYRWLK